jgi:ATP-binding cassette, subfamily B, bacterial
MNNIIMKLTNVQFKYPNNDKIILKDVNLELEQGKSYALVGPTGEGKSTLAMLLAGIIQPTSGSIEYKGQNLSKINKTTLSDSIGFILQEPFLYEGDILDNIIYGNKRYMENYIFDPYSSDLKFYETPTNNAPLLDIVREEIKVRGLEHLLDRFPDGLSTKVTNSSENISLGQKQIINFLRVILRDPEFLILDEATANLDTITEQILQDILAKLPKKTTKVIIAHRLNTIKDVDYKYQVLGGRVELIN